MRKKMINFKKNVKKTRFFLQIHNNDIFLRFLI